MPLVIDYSSEGGDFMAGMAQGIGRAVERQRLEREQERMRREARDEERRWMTQQQATDRAFRMQEMQARAGIDAEARKEQANLRLVEQNTKRGQVLASNRALAAAMRKLYPEDAELQQAAMLVENAEEPAHGLAGQLMMQADRTREANRQRAETLAQRQADQGRDDERRKADQTAGWQYAVQAGLVKPDDEAFRNASPEMQDRLIDNARMQRQVDLRVPQAASPSAPINALRLAVDADGRVVAALGRLETAQKAYQAAINAPFPDEARVERAEKRLVDAEQAFMTIRAQVEQEKGVRPSATPSGAAAPAEGVSGVSVTAAPPAVGPEEPLPDMSRIVDRAAAEQAADMAGREAKVKGLNLSDAAMARLVLEHYDRIMRLKGAAPQGRPASIGGAVNYQWR